MVKHKVYDDIKNQRFLGLEIKSLTLPSFEALEKEYKDFEVQG